MSTLIFELNDGTPVVVYAGPENTTSDTRMCVQIGDDPSFSAENALALGAALQAWATSVLGTASQGGDGTSTEVRALKGMVEERTTQRDNTEAQRDSYKLALENLNVDMEVLRDESRELADKFQEIKERLDDAERRPWWGDRPDETEIVAKVLRICGVNDDVSDEGFERAIQLVKGYFADQYPPDLRPDFVLKEGWNAG